MKQVVVVKLVPDAASRAVLVETLRVCNAEANRIAAIAFAHRDTETGRIEREYALRGRVYAEAKATGIGSQLAQHVVKKVCDAYRTVYAQARSGLLRGRRPAKALAKPVAFRAGAAQPFDDRCLSWDLEARTVSIRAAEGRLRGIGFACSKQDLKVLRAHRQGELDLFERDGELYLAATVDIPEAEAMPDPVDFIGVDRGVVNLATTSDEVNFQGKGLERYRRRMARARAELQAKQTKAAKRRLKQRARRESRHAAHTNHKIAKAIVSAAERTGRGIALEDLEGIRERVRLTRSQRGRISNWPFYQLAQHIAYKAKRAGVPVVVVDARHTSQMCPLCHHAERANRRSRDRFECRGCGLAGPADVIAAVNVRARGRMAWAVSQGSRVAA
ncbi:transposase [Glycomyces sp. L485]|uniref:RNA-guided endonuclease InsQ/TnpB family protein n=1 Tax=Glycomyces sp. L485 TaxID=2909235 RepID=UPI001F4BCCF9|nr:transposase [Glycomyces sp. L485]